MHASKKPNCIQKMKLDTERMTGFGAYRVDGYDVNYLFGLRDLCEDFLSKESHVLELGCNDGVSTRLFCEYTNEVTAVDINLTKKFKSLLNDSSNIKFYHLDFDLFFKKNTNKYDLIYIDGPHDYSSVKSHIENCKKIIKKHGVICGHDYHSEVGVIEAVNESFGKENIKIYSDSSWAATNIS